MIECTKFKSHNSGSLQGFADLYVEKWGLEIYGCSLYMKDGASWVNLPSKAYKDSEGVTKYSPDLRFRNKDHYSRFVLEAKAAIDKYCLENGNKTEIEQPKNFCEPDEDLPF